MSPVDHFFGNEDTTVEFHLENTFSNLIRDIHNKSPTPNFVKFTEVSSLCSPL